jgi:hypothetical protein
MLITDLIHRQAQMSHVFKEIIDHQLINIAERTLCSDELESLCVVM